MDRGRRNFDAEAARKDSSGRKSLNSVFGQKIVGHELSAFNALFAYPSDTRKLESIVTNGGTVTQANSMLVVSTGTNIAGKAIASSRRALQYMPGKEGYCKFTAIFTAGKLQSRQMIGLFDDLNGFAVGMNNDKLAIFRKRNGAIVEIVEQEDFSEDCLDGQNSNFIINPTKGNVFRISFGFLGFATITFEVLAGKNSWIPFHIIDYPNNFEETHITLPYLKIRAEVENTGNNSNIVLKTASVECGVIDGGGDSVSVRMFALTNSFTFTAGTNTRLLIFHNKATYGGLPNRVEALLSIVNSAVEANKTITIKRFKLATAPTGGTWSSVSSNSLMEYSIDATISLTGAELTLAFSMGKSGQFFENIEEINLRMLPDDYIAYVFTSTGAGELELGQSWKEMF